MSNKKSGPKGDTREILEKVEAECQKHHDDLGRMLQKIKRIREDFVGRKTVGSLTLRDKLIRGVLAEAAEKGSIN